MGFENAFWAFFALPLQNGMQLQQNAEPSHKADTTFSTHHRILPTMASLQGSTMFSGCLNATGSVDLVCIANAIEDNANMNAERVRTWLLVISATMVFLMQLGFAMLSAGCVRRKNASNLLLKNILDTSTACVGFFVLGYGLAFGGQDPNAGATFVGTSNFLLTGATRNPRMNLVSGICCSPSHKPFRLRFFRGRGSGIILFHICLRRCCNDHHRWSHGW